MNLQHFVNLFGFEPWEALRAATAWSGETWVGATGEKMGRVAPGYLADLLVIDSNPLLDITLMRDRHALLTIMKNREFHKPWQGRAVGS